MSDDFSEQVKRTLAFRVANICSNPTCRAVTSGPQIDRTKALNPGVAAHIMLHHLGGRATIQAFRLSIGPGMETEFGFARTAPSW